MTVEQARLQKAYEQLNAEAEAGGYHLNPDEEWTLGLVEGLLVNEDRYGYRACPCRLALGDKDADLDIICPCDYRDADLHDWGACYCALYVSDEVLKGKQALQSVPERRPDTPPHLSHVAEGETADGIRLWRCRVCGYLCAREHPPGVCPVCKAKRERFEVFVLPLSAIPRDP
jgi:ferredoxin-thioredoxin reductase catalytic subunit